jgi:hypothetical protein
MMLVWERVDPRIILIPELVIISTLAAGEGRTALSFLLSNFGMEYEQKDVTRTLNREVLYTEEPVLIGYTLFHRSACF